jgi:hypothetical protein
MRRATNQVRAVRSQVSTHHREILLARVSDRYLVELMHSIQAPGLLAMTTGFFAETRRPTGILDWKVLGLDPLLAMERSNRLLGRSNQVLGLGLMTGLDLVQLLVELRELCTLRHDLTVHKVWRLKQQHTHTHKATATGITSILARLGDAIPRSHVLEGVYSPC